MADYLVILKDKRTNEQIFKVIESEPKDIIDNLGDLIYGQYSLYDKDVIVETVTKL